MVIIIEDNIDDDLDDSFDNISSESDRDWCSCVNLYLNNPKIYKDIYGDKDNDGVQDCFCYRMRHLYAEGKDWQAEYSYVYYSNITNEYYHIDVTEENECGGSPLYIQFRINQQRYSIDLNDYKFRSDETYDEESYRLSCVRNIFRELRISKLDLPKDVVYTMFIIIKRSVYVIKDEWFEKIYNKVFKDNED